MVSGPDQSNELRAFDSDDGSVSLLILKIFERNDCIIKDFDCLVLA